MTNWVKAKSLEEVLRSDGSQKLFYTTPEYEDALEKSFIEMRKNHPGLTDEQILAMAFRKQPK